MSGTIPLHKLTLPVLRLLADGRFHSGEVLARKLGVTRATIWNALKSAEAAGVTFFSVRGRGYRLPQAFHLLDPNRVLAATGAHHALWTLQFHDVLPSTNRWLMQHLATDAKHGTCVATEFQTEGKGRRGRVWQAALGSSLTFSILWKFSSGASSLTGLSLAVGVALLEALRELGMSDVSLKWPNDILRGDGKLAGILIELQGDMEGPTQAVIGIGVNIQLASSLKQRIDQPSADLGQSMDPNVLLGTILCHLACVLPLFSEQGFAALRQTWIDSHAWQDKKVQVTLPDGRLRDGIARNVTEYGALQIETERGLECFTSGEISLRCTP